MQCNQFNLTVGIFLSYDQEENHLWYRQFNIGASTHNR